MAQAEVRSIQELQRQAEYDHGCFEATLTILGLVAATAINNDKRTRRLAAVVLASALRSQSDPGDRVALGRQETYQNFANKLIAVIDGE